MFSFTFYTGNRKLFDKKCLEIKHDEELTKGRAHVVSDTDLEYLLPTGRSYCEGFTVVSLSVRKREEKDFFCLI